MYKNLYKPAGSETTFSLVASYVYDTIELLETYTDKNGRIAIKEIEWEE